jgi:hypothetical protein
MYFSFKESAMFFPHLNHGATNQTETELANSKLLSVSTASASVGSTEYQTASTPAGWAS